MSVDLIASNAVKRCIPSFHLKACVIPPVVVNPKTKKNRRDNQREYKGSRREIEHTLEGARDAMKRNAREPQKKTHRPEAGAL
jgi:hypothetical protein